MADESDDDVSGRSDVPGDDSAAPKDDGEQRESSPRGEADESWPGEWQTADSIADEDDTDGGDGATDEAGDDGRGGVVDPDGDDATAADDGSESDPETAVAYSNGSGTRAVGDEEGDEEEDDEDDEGGGDEEGDDEDEDDESGGDEGDGDDEDEDDEDEGDDSEREPSTTKGSGRARGNSRRSSKGRQSVKQVKSKLPDDSDDEEKLTQPSDDEQKLTQPPDDEEMPLTDHIEEMIRRSAVVLVIGATATTLALPFAMGIINLIWEGVLPPAETGNARPHVYGPLEPWLARIKVASLAGILAALPVAVYETYLFMRPGLYPRERRYYLAAVPMSVVLGAVGMLFSFVVVLPVLFTYFLYYSEGTAVIAFGLLDTFNLIIALTAFLAIAFQIPLFIMLAIMMGVTSRRWLAEKRLYFWAAFAGLSFMFTLDPTFMAPILVAITMILLFEGTLWLLKWTGRE